MSRFYQQCLHLKLLSMLVYLFYCISRSVHISKSINHIFVMTIAIEGRHGVIVIYNRNGVVMASSIPSTHKGHGFRYVQAGNKCYLRAGAAVCIEFK